MKRYWLIGLILGLLSGLLVAEIVRNRRKVSVQNQVIAGLQEAIYNRPRAYEMEGAGNGRG